MPNTTNPPRAVQLCHETLLWVVPVLDKFPRNRRFTLGERIESGLLNVLADLVDASYSKKNQTSLRAANKALSVVRHCWRLAMELGTVSQRQYQHGAKLLVELGRQIGGWYRFEAGRSV